MFEHCGKVAAFFPVPAMVKQRIQLNNNLLPGIGVRSNSQLQLTYYVAVNRKQITNTVCYSSTQLLILGTMLTYGFLVVCICCIHYHYSMRLLGHLLPHFRLYIHAVRVKFILPPCYERIDVSLLNSLVGKMPVLGKKRWSDARFQQLSSSAKDFLKSCLKQKHRPSIKQLLQHEFLTGVRLTAYLLA